MAAELSLARGQACIGCEVQVGGYHRAGCLETECPQSGLPQTYCPGQHGHSGGGIWTGLVPGEAAAVSFGWFAALRPGKGWTPIPPQADAAEYGADYMPDFNRVFHQARWDEESQQWIKPEIPPINTTLA